MYVHINNIAYEAYKSRNASNHIACIKIGLNEIEKELHYLPKQLREEFLGILSMD